MRTENNLTIKNVVICKENTERIKKYIYNKKKMLQLNDPVTQLSLLE